MDMKDAFEMLKKELAIRLQGIAPDRAVFVGVGNRLRGDDAIGPALIDLLRGKVPHVIDAGSAPENVTASVKRLKPSAIVFLDAARFGDERPGYMRIVEAGDMEKLEASAHNFSLDIVMEYLKESTGADVFLVGVHPERIGEGEEISPALEKPLEELAMAVIEALNKS
jgi:hydrogenase 3 maturation protease